MYIKIYLIHHEWKDTIILNLTTKRLFRLSVSNEYASFNINKNILTIKWDKWDEEYFVAHNDNNIYYYSKKNIIIHEDWEDDCYFDIINNIVYKSIFNSIGIIDNVGNDIIIKWIDFESKFYDIITECYEIIDENEYDKSIFDNLNIKKCEENVSIFKSVEENVSIDKLIEENTDIIEKLEENVNIIEPIEEKIENPMNYVIYNPNYNGKKIPNILHFVFGFKEQYDDFELYRYIAIKSAYEINKPDKVYFYYFYEPFGFWWEKIKPILTLQKINPPKEIFGNPVLHYAHKADIIRLQKLNEIGGIYLDIDTICLRSFNDLLNNSFVMGYQGNHEYTENYGLCNAVMLAEPNSKFGLNWMNSYRSFRSKGRDEFWDEHSVILPLSLAKDNPDDITILNCKSFFYPLWNDISDILFNEKFDIDKYKNLIANNYCIHLWDTYSHSYLKNLNENIIFSQNTLYNIISRKFLKNRISLVLLTYNRYDMTVKCLDSYLKCLDRDDIEEIIIFDNNSNWELINYLNNYQNKHEKIKIIYSDDNLGVCGGRLVLFNEAIGDIIISIDSDAYLLDNSFFDRIKDLLYDEHHGIVGISGAYIKSWDFGTQHDINENDPNEYYCDHIAGCCQAFRKDLYIFGFGLDEYYGKFWVEDTDLSMQSLHFNKKNLKINQSKYLEHHWGGSGSNFQELFAKNWQYFSDKWRNKVLTHL